MHFSIHRIGSCPDNVRTGGITMRKIYASLLALTLSLPAFSMPSPADALVSGLLTKNADFRGLLNRFSTEDDSNPWASKFDAVSAEVVIATETLKMHCDQWSRSGSILKVELTKGGNSVGTYYFSTP